MSLKEYKPGQAFAGVIGRTFDVSQPAWPAPNRAREGAPNVLFMVLDDTGFGQLGCYGSPIKTPHLDALAADGLRYNNMHTTALCSPSRSCMLTGRNHHSNAMACITEGSEGFPGSNGNIPFENGMLSEILLQNGYNTYALGKWHLTPAEQISAAGPYDRWRLGRGFERFYGFLGGDTHQYYPDLIYDNHQVDPPKTPEQGYHLTPDLVDKAKAMIADAKQVAPNKPFFMYFCTGAMHAPHHVPKEWADKYKGKFDAGWDAYRQQVFAKQKELGIVPESTTLSRHDPDVQDWDKLSADERRLYARMMEVFAGFLEHTDHYIGELIAFLKQMGEYENTLIMVISDNGASAEGGPHGSVNEGKFFNNVPDDLKQNLAAIDELGGPKYFNHYPWGWTHAGNTPFRRWKRETYRGGTSDPFIVTWPKGIKAKGEIRTQYCHAIDMAPTVLDALGIEPPDAGPRLVNVPHSVSVHVNVPKGGAEGVLYSMGGVDGGFSFCVQDGKLTYGYNYVADQRFKVQSANGGLPEGDHILSFEFTPTGKPDIAKGKGVPATIKLFVDGNQTGRGDLPVTIPLNLGLSAGVCVGSDAGAPVMTDYDAPFPFTGTVKRVLVDVSGQAIEDKAAKMRMYLARQ